MYGPLAPNGRRLLAIEGKALRHKEETSGHVFHLSILDIFRVKIFQGEGRSGYQARDYVSRITLRPPLHFFLVDRSGS